MRKMTLVKKMLWMLSVLFIITACEDKMDEHYEVPDWVNGNAWEVLDELGNYTIFLKGVELAGFEPIVSGKNILTIMAPNDEAFQAYLKKHNKNSIEEFSQEELIKLIGFHLMYYSYPKEKLINFRPSEGDEATEDDKAWMAGMFYKHRTKSSDPKSLERDTSGNYVFVYHQERYLPVYSYKYFESKKIDPTTNYEYFYPTSKWTGSNGFNVSNASVQEYEIPLTNGYLYLVDQVIEPLETIYKELQTNKDYSTFLKMYNQYGYYYKDEELTREYGEGYDLYLHYHTSPLPNIACEWSMSSYISMLNLCYTSYTVFAPSNKAMNNLFTDFWSKGGYKSLEDVNRLAMLSLLYNCVYTGPVAFPEEIKKGDILNNYGIPIEVETDKIPQENRVMCANGALYKLDELTYPTMFTSVTGPAFRDKNYSSWLHMISGASMVAPLVAENANLTMLMPNNTQLEILGIIQEKDELKTSSSGELATMPSSERTDYVNAHVSSEKTKIATTGKQVIHTNTTFYYWYVQDHKITSSVYFNNIIENNMSYDYVFFDLTEIKNNDKSWDNGKVYIYGAPEAFMPLSAYSTDIQHQLVVTKLASKAYYGFARLIQLSGLADQGTQTLKFLGKQERCMVFIPTNEAINKAIAENRIPGLSHDGSSVTDSLKLASYLKSYFISTAQNGMSDYVYTGSNMNETFETCCPYMRKEEDGVYRTHYVPLKIIDNGSNITVQQTDGISGIGSRQEIEVDMSYGGFPFTYHDGGVHFLKDVL